MKNTEKFTGKSDVYGKSRPDYVKSFINYLYDIIPENKVIADVWSLYYLIKLEY